MIRMKRAAVAISVLVACGFAAQAFAQADVARDVEALVRDVPRADSNFKDMALDPDVAKRLGFISSIAVDSKNGLTYLLQRGPDFDPVVVVDGAGHVVRSWGKGMFQTPHSVRLDPEGYVWTVDSQSSNVLKFDAAGKLLMKIEVGGQPDPTKTTGTADIAFGPEGHLFIADGYGNARILEYAPDGTKIREWGSHGTGPGQFNTPHALLRDGEFLYVADRENGRIQKFDLTGHFQAEWKGLVKPMALERATDGSFLVAIGYRNVPGQSPPWLAWVVTLDLASDRILQALEVGDDAHGMALAGNMVLTGGETGPNAAVHAFKIGTNP